VLAAASTDYFISERRSPRRTPLQQTTKPPIYWFGSPEYSAIFEKVLFRNTKTRDVDLAKEFSHRSTQIFTALEELSGSGKGDLSPPVE